jgi:hypothetical protein
MLIPQLTTTTETSNNSSAPVTTVVGRNSAAFPPDDPSRQDNTRSVVAPQSQPAAASRPASDDWTWGNAPDTSAATIGRGGNTPPRTETNRDFNVAPSVAAAPQDTKKTTPKETKDLWADDWGKPSPPSSTAPGAGATVTAPSISASPNKQPPVATNTAQPSFPVSSASPSLNAPTNSPLASGSNVASVQAPATPVAGPTNAPKANAPAEEKPWMLTILAVLGLAGSLAANFFIGWSYLDTRQKYESLVRRTADTFRRTKQVAA